MKKRGVILGTPRCVVWPSALAGVVFVMVLLGLLFGVAMMALDGVMQNVHRDAGGASSNWGFFGWYWFGWGAGVVVWLWLSGSKRRFLRRFKKLNGRVCLVCRGEVDVGGEECGKCGAGWSLEGLGKKWVKAAGAGKGSGR